MKKMLSDKYKFFHKRTCVAFPCFWKEPVFFKVDTRTIPLKRCKSVANYIIVVDDAKNEDHQEVIIDYDGRQYKTNGRIRILVKNEALHTIGNINESYFEFDPHERIVYLA